MGTSKALKFDYHVAEHLCYFFLWYQPCTMKWGGAKKLEMEVGEVTLIQKNLKTVCFGMCSIAANKFNAILIGSNIKVLIMSCSFQQIQNKHTKIEL